MAHLFIPALGRWRQKEVVPITKELVSWYRITFPLLFLGVVLLWPRTNRSCTPFLIPLFVWFFSAFIALACLVDDIDELCVPPHLSPFWAFLAQRNKRNKPFLCFRVAFILGGGVCLDLSIERALGDVGVGSAYHVPPTIHFEPTTTLLLAMLAHFLVLFYFFIAVARR